MSFSGVKIVRNEKERGKENERQRLEEKTCVEFSGIVAMVVAREGTIRIPFDKNKHCRGVVRGPVAFIPENRSTRDSAAGRIPS